MSKMEAKLPIGESISVGYKYLTQNWTMWIPAALVVGIIGGAAQAMVTRPGISLLGIIGWAISLAVTLAFGAAVFRHIFRGEFKAPFGLRAGPDELRLCGVTFGISLIFGIIFAFIFIIFITIVSTLTMSAGIDPKLAETNPAAFVAAFMEAIGEGGAMLALLTFIAIMCGFIFVSVRLSLMQTATMHEERMMVFQTWSFTKGNFWQILLVQIATVFPLAFGFGIVDSIVKLVIIGGTNAEALLAASRANVLVVGFFQSTGSALISLPLFASMAYIYKGLRPPEEEMQRLAELAKK